MTLSAWIKEDTEVKYVELTSFDSIESVIQEDDKLLMYIDLSAERV